MQLKTFNFIATVIIVIFAIAMFIWLFSIFGTVDHMLESIALCVGSFSAFFLIILATFKNKWVKQDSNKS